MRVLLTTDTIGGVWTFTKELVDGLLALGHDVALISFGRTPTPLQSTWCARTTSSYRDSFTYRPCDIPLEWMQHNEMVFSAGAPVLADVARRFSPDILHSSQFCWGALDLDIPKLITAHSDVMSWAATAKPDVLIGSPWLNQYRSLVQRGLDGADAVVAPTKWMQAALLQNFHVPCRFEVIYNGRTIAACDTPEPQQKLQAVSVGRLWDAGKGLSIVFQITSPMPLMLAGEESFEGAATALLPGVTGLGRLDETELLRLFQQSSVYIATSVYEPFGLAPLEAALCGCAVLARDLDSLREVWGEAALYFRDAAELEAALLKLSTNATVLSQVRLACSTRARQFTTRRMSATYLQLYRSLLTDGAAPRAVAEELAAHEL